MEKGDRVSEKTLWKRIEKHMESMPGYAGDRIENCDQMGVPDSIIVYMYNGERHTILAELKDWSDRSKKIHPLTVEQFNFMDTYGGAVVVKVEKDSIHVCPPDKVLTEGGARSVTRALEIGVEVKFDENFRHSFIESLQDKTEKFRDFYL